MARALRDTPWPVLLLVLSFLCPTELSLYVGQARLPPHRVLLLLLLPYAFARLFGRRGVKLHLFDVTMLLFAAWTAGAYIYHHGQADGLQTGGALALDSFASYLVARAFVRDERSFAGTAGALFLAVAVTGLIALPETLSGQFFVHDMLRQLTGYAHPTGVEKRLGLTRAFGTFDHPIHLGTFCASGLALCFYATPRRGHAILRAVAIAAAALMSLSSAPMLSLGLQGGLIAANRLTRGIKGRLAMGLGAIAVLFLVTSLVATRSPFQLIATGLTLDPWTGYYRLMIWEHGLANIWTSPWAGLGLNDWDRPVWMVSSTIDAFWLVITMRTGLPAFLLLAATMLLLARGSMCGVANGQSGLRSMATGWMISLAGLSLLACTVHYWNVPFAYFFFFLGLGGCLADPLRARMRSVAHVADCPKTVRVAWIAPDALPGGLQPGVSLAAALPVWPLDPPRWPVPVLAKPAAVPARRRCQTAPAGR